MPNVRELENALPVAPLKVLAMESAETIGRRVNNYLVEFRKNMKIQDTTIPLPGVY